LPLIGFRQCRTTQIVESWFRDEGLSPDFVFRSDDNGTVQAMVSAGVGIALVPRLTVDLNDPTCKVIDVDDLVPPRRLSLVWHRDRYRSAAAQAFIDVAVEASSEYASRPVALAG
jgi:DNA-binding transcriptional LysR family regulator